VILAPGETLGGRFQIVRCLGEGSMGEVYQALDRELDEAVAVKLLHADVARDPEAVQRFKREVQLARRVTNPHVCRVFDLFQQPLAPADGAAPTVLAFVTMELLTGDTLAQRIAHRGALPSAETLPIVTQVAEAICAAHEAGVVHRDLKSANVMLVPAPAAPGGARAVVTDFGLAHCRQLASLTTAGTLVGSPAYMAPEQVRGGRITPAADIYALGVVLFEMLTGRLPFEADTALGTALKRLHEGPPSLRASQPQLDEGWERLLRGCLAIEPRDRPTGSQVLDALAHLAESGGGLGGGRGAARQLAPAVGAALLVTVVAGIAAWQWGLASWPGGRTRAGAPRTAVAVLGFENLARNADSAYIESSLLEMLPTELAAGEHLRLVAGEQVEQVRRDLGLTSARTFASPTLAKLRQRLGADLVIAGAYLVVPSPDHPRQIRCDLQIQDTATGETVGALQEVGTEAGFLDLVSHLGAKLRARLASGPLTAAEGRAVRAALPANDAAARLYAEGVAKLNRFEAMGARSLFTQALASDPRNPLIHARLAASWATLGYAQRARDELTQAAALATHLRLEDRRQIEAQLREIQGDPAGAAAIYAELWSYYPDSLDYGLDLARSQASAGQGALAMATLDRLHRLPPPGDVDPRIDLAEAEVAVAVSSFEKARVAAVRAARRARGQQAQLLVARSRYCEGVALRFLGRLPEAEAAGGEASRIAARGGDLLFAAQALSFVGTVLLTRGEVVAARATFERVLGQSRQVGADHLQAMVLANLGICQRRQGDWQGARDSYTEAVALFHLSGDRRHEAAVIENLAQILAQRGALREARTQHDAALSLCRQIGDLSSGATVLLNLGTLDLQEANLAAAAAHFSAALATYQRIGEAGGAAEAQAGGGRVLAERGQLDAARRVIAGAVVTADRAGERGTAASLRLDLARLEIAAGRPAVAAGIAREVEAGPDASELTRESAAVVLGAALVASGQAADAAATLDRVASALIRSGDLDAQVESEIVRGRILAAAGHGAAAQRQLAAASAKARRLGMTRFDLEARLAAAEGAPQDPATPERLAAIARDAAAHGLELLHRRATARPADLTQAPAGAAPAPARLAPPPLPPAPLPGTGSGNRTARFVGRRIDLVALHLAVEVLEVDARRLCRPADVAAGRL
jgi:eukaryotic-like serine/threonine-protein kinase